MKKILFIALIQWILPSHAIGQWVVWSQNSVHHDNKAVFMLNDSLGWMGGTEGSIQKTTDGGNSWIMRHIDHTGDLVAVVAFLNSSIGYALARSLSFGIVYVTTDGGDSWQTDSALRDSALTESITFDDLAFTRFGDSLFIWLTGYSDTGTPVAYHQYVYLSKDTGKTWNNFNRLPAIPYLSVFKLIFFNPNAGVVSGGNVLCRTTDGGNTWSEYRIGPINTSMFYSLQFLNADTGFFAGQDSANAGRFVIIGRTFDGGMTWTLDSTNAFSPIHAADMHFVNPNLGFDVTLNDNRIFRTTDGGANWKGYTSPNDDPLFAISTTDGKTVVAVGARGKVIMSNDSGATWNDVTPLGQVQLTYVKLLSNDLAAALGTGNEFLLSTDSLKSWTEYDMPTGLNVHVAFGDSLNAWIGDDSARIYHSTNTGKTWELQFNGMEFSAGNPIYGIEFLNDNMGCAVGARGSILFTRTGGGSWETSKNNSTSNLFSVFVASPDRAWAVGDGGTILFSSDGLTSWLPQASQVNTALRSVIFSDTLHGMILGDGGVILKTSNGGVSWTLEHSPDSALNAMSFIGVDHGWLVGDAGKIFTTTDGGGTWQGETSGVTSNLRDVDFLDDSLGVVAGDDGVLLITTNGGGVTGITPGKIPVSPMFSLSQNYPNPFNPTTAISYELSPQAGSSTANSYVTLKVYDVLGRLVRTLVNKVEQPGSYLATFDATDLPSGVYFYRLQAGGFSQTRKLMILK